MIQDDAGGDDVGLGYGGTPGNGYGSINLLENNRGSVYFTGLYGGLSQIADGNLSIGTSTATGQLSVVGEDTSAAIYGSGSPDFEGGGGEHTSGGTWVNASSRDLKTDFTPVDDQTILTEIDELPITKWVYKTDTGAWHIGPVAEDFYSIFGLGDDNKSISTIDPAGVALVGVKALDEKITAQQQEIDVLQTQNATLASEVQQLMNK
jgi:hypothetical protein